MSETDNISKSNEYGKSCMDMEGELASVRASDQNRLTWSYHKGSYSVNNNLGWRILSLKVVHTTSYYGAQEHTFSDIDAGSWTESIPINYTTGIASPYDYWYVEGVAEFGPGIATFKSKNNFYCSISASDSGKVDLHIMPDIDGFPGGLDVRFSNSSSCSTVFLYP